MDTTHSQTAHGHDDIAKHIKVYVGVFLALLIGTVLTVTMYYVHFERVAVTVTIALFIATIKASLVAGFFMHLISEKKAIYAILVATVFFFVGMMFLTVWARGAMPTGTTYVGKVSQPGVEAAAEPGH